MGFLQAGAGRRACALLACVAASCMLHAAPAGAAPKTDVVLLRNGDRITGEIKSLEHNQLKLSTVHMGTVYIEWDKIARVETNQYLLLERIDGSRYYGQLIGGAEEAELLVRRDDQARPEPVSMTSVVRAEPIIGGHFIDRLDGYLSAGLDVAKADGRSSADFAGGVSSRTRIREWSIDGSANVTDDDNGAASERYALQGNWRQFRRDRDFYAAFGGFESNTELDLDLRTTLGGGYGRYLVQTNRAEWVGGAGLAYSHETYKGREAVDSLALALITGFAIYRYDFPETDVSGNLTVLPSLTESDRVRAEADLRAKYEFVDDLYFEIKLYGSYDSQPPLEDSEQSDYGIVTSLGYSF